MSRPQDKRFCIDDAFDEELEPTSTLHGHHGHHGQPQGHLAARAHAFGQTHSPAQPPRTLDLDLSLSCRTYKCPEDTVSKDSDSLIHEYLPVNEGDAQSGDVYCWRHPKVRENWKTVGVAAALLVFGAVLLAMGVYGVAFHDQKVQGVVFLVAGFICFIPGAYHVVYVYLAARGFRGYDFYHLPLFT